MYDIVVCGGGSAGAAVALFAAEGGKDVALIEQFGELGGILTSDCLGYVMDAKDKKGFVETLRAAVGTPVSYTHLDVYKRQSCDSVALSCDRRWPSNSEKSPPVRAAISAKPATEASKLCFASAFT